MAKLNLKEINEAIRLIRKDLGEVSKTPFLEGQLKEARKELTSLRKEFQSANNDLKGWSESLKSSLSELTKVDFELSLAKKSFRGLVSIADQFNQIQENGVFLDKKKIASLKLQSKQHEENLGYAVKFGNLDKKAKDEIQDRINSMKEFNKELSKAGEFQERVQGATGVGFFGALSEISGAIPGMNSLTGMFDAASKAAEETTFNNEKNKIEVEGINKLQDKQRMGDIQSLKSGKDLNRDTIERLGIEKQIGKSTGTAASKRATKLGLGGINEKGLAPLTKMVPKSMSAMMAGIKSLGPALTKALGPIAIVIELVQGFMAADSQAVKLQKTMMLTKSEARQFNMGLQRAAAHQDNISVTGTKVAETFHSMSKSLGFIAKFSEATLGSAAKLQTVLGISEASTANLAAASEATGISLEDNYKNILATSYELQRQYGVQLDMQGIIEEVGQVTGQIRAGMSGNVTEITKAVTQAKLLGTNLKSVAAAGKQLLNFEQSISAEMAAELLTGKQLNLERARAAALMNDQETLAKELAKNMGDFTEFTKLNVIQQDALAAALGMQSDQVSDMLFAQETMGKTAEELRAIGKDELADKLEAKTAQDQMNAAMEQLKQTFVQLGTALLPIVNLVGIVAGILQFLMGLLQDGIGFATGSQEFGDLSNTMKGGKTIVDSGKGLIGLAEGGIINKPTMAIIGAGGESEAVIPLSRLNDITGGGNMKETNALLKSLITVVANKSSDVILDGNKVGMQLAYGSPQIG